MENTQLLAVETGLYDSLPALRTLFLLLVCLVLLHFVFIMCGCCLLDVCCFLKRRQRGSGCGGERRLQGAGRSGRKRNWSVWEKNLFKRKFSFQFKRKSLFKVSDDSLKSYFWAKLNLISCWGFMDKDWIVFPYEADMSFCGPWVGFYYLKWSNSDKL